MHRALLAADAVHAKDLASVVTASVIGAQMLIRQDSISALLNLDKERIFAPDRPDLLVQEVSCLLFLEHYIKVPEDLCQHEPAFGICKVLSNAVSSADREWLISGIVVVTEAR